MLWQAKTRCCIDALEQDADALAASGFAIGHIAIGIALAYLDFRFGDLNWRNGHPRLATWHATFEARPSVLANAPVDDR
jgi:glutathione S-transferase